MSEKKRRIRWGLEDWRGIALVAIMLGGLIAISAGLIYFGGMPEGISEDITGSYWHHKIPSGDPKIGVGAIFGLVILAIGLLVYAATTVMIRRSKK